LNRAEPSTRLRIIMSSDEIERRVCECFGNVFPALPAEQIPTLRQEQVPDWDSVVHVTLLASLAEEFSIEVDFEAAQDMTSAPAAVQLVRSALGG
jgi:acyl carrier protein